MPFVDPERLPEVAQVVDLSRERPTVDRVRLVVQTPVIGVRAFFDEIDLARRPAHIAEPPREGSTSGNGSLVAPAFSFMMVGGGAAGVGFVIKYIASPVVAMVAMAVVFVAGLIFVDRWRGK